MPALEKIAYGAINATVLAQVPASTHRLLDVGCGIGAFGQAVKQHFPCEIVGLTYSEEEATQARAHLDRVVVCDLNTYSFDELGAFDCIVCSHVLEHLYDPTSVLKRLRACLTAQGIVVVALPNIVHWRQRWQFLRGRFRYTEGGLMDSTHYRFFDWESARALARDAGLDVVHGFADGYLPLPGIRAMLGPAAAKLDNAVSRARPNLFGLQFILVCQARKVA